MGSFPGDPTCGGAVAPNKVIKGKLETRAFAGKAQFLNNKKATNVAQTDAALAVAASAAGGRYIAKTSHCGLAYTNTA